MKIGIIGPNKNYSTNIDDRKRLIDETVEIIAKSGNEIILTPDKNSLLEYFGQKFTESGGKKVWLVIPTQEENHEGYLNTELGEIIDCQIWDVQANEFNRQCDLFVCIGYAWGALKEIACAQYFNKKKVYILNEFISAELPQELNFLVDYISIKDLQAVL